MSLDFTTVPLPPSNLSFICSALHAALRHADGAWRAARYHGADHDLVRELAATYIEAHHEYQRARWGRVHDRLTVAGLLR